MAGGRPPRIGLNPLTPGLQRGDDLVVPPRFLLRPMTHDLLREPARPAPTAADETDRAIIQLPENATFYGDRYLAVAFDRCADGPPHPTVLGGGSPPFLGASTIISVLCGDRAKRTVDRSRTVLGRAVTPEGYLALWRSALRAPLSGAEFAARYGLVPVFRIDAPLAALRGTRRAWTPCPWETFDDFEDAYRDRLVTSAGEERFQLEIDFRAPDGPRDAFYAASYVCGHRSPGTARTELVLRAVSTLQAQTTQVELFAA